MLVIGEKINSIRPSVNRIIKERNTKDFEELALQQITKGAQVLDVNVDDVEKAQIETSKENMKWAIGILQKTITEPLMLDSSHPEVLAAGMEIYDFSKGIPFLNSLTLENREKIVPLLLKYDCFIVVMADLAKVNRIKRYLNKKEVNSERIYIDSKVNTIALDPEGALRAIQDLKKIHKKGLKALLAPSNISFQAPGRKLLNQVFIDWLERVGVDAIICDPADLKVVAAKQVLEGKDRRFKKYRKCLEV